MSEDIFRNIESKTSIKKEEIIKLASEVETCDLQNEEVLRSLIQKVSKLANKPISKERENEIINKVHQNFK